MRVEIVAVGTELLLGQIVDTNSTVIASELARCGLECHFQTRVGDNHARIVSALELALGRADAVIVCGGLGPTQDDITREAVAAVMGVELRRDPVALAALYEIFTARAIEMPASNLRQADVPDGASLIRQRSGTAPGLICPVGTQVIYAVPGVPEEMAEMLAEAILPDLQARSGAPAVIRSRSIRTVGISESKLAELVTPRLEALDREGPGAPTIAFLASFSEGVTVRITVKSSDEASASRRLGEEEAAVRRIVGAAVYGTDGETIESAVGALLVARGLTLAVAESFTGGLLASRIVATPGASAYFRGGIVAYDSEVKFSLLGVERGPVVSAEAAVAMADGACKLLGADVAIATTGVAGPERQEDRPPGTAFIATSVPGGPTIATAMRASGSRSRIREYAALRAMNLLRTRLLAE